MPQPTRTLAFAAALFVAAAFTAPPGWTTPENRSACANAGEDAQSLLTCIKGMNARLIEIEDEMEAEDADDSDDRMAVIEKELKAAKAENASLKADLAALAKKLEGPLTVKAPFTVNDGAGQPVFSVKKEGATALAVLGEPEGKRVTFAAGDAVATLGLLNGDNAVVMVASNDRTTLRAGSGRKGSVEMGVSGTLTGVSVRSGENEAANLGVPAGKTGGVRVFDGGGRQVGVLASNGSRGGAGALFVGNGARNAVQVFSDQEGMGIVEAYGEGVNAAAALMGKTRTMGVYNAAGASVANLGKSENSEGGYITARDPGGEGVFRAGHRSDIGGGEACVYREKRKQVVCLGLEAPGVLGK
jgi:hypothetical protein